MRYVYALVMAVSALAAGCGTDGNSAGQDLAASGQDLAVSSSFDLSAANDDLSSLTGCHGLALCLVGCKGSATCQMSCRAAATGTARKLYRKLVDCRLATCYPHPDGGAEPCMLGAPPSALCSTCLKDADTMSGMCSGAGSPSWCGACYPELAACTSDLP